MYGSKNKSLKKPSGCGLVSTGSDARDLEAIRYRNKSMGDGESTVTLMKEGGKTKSKGKICPEGKAWAKRTFDKYPSAYANLAASKYCKDPNYAKKSKGGKRKGN
jgi:hypothetical protein